MSGQRNPTAEIFSASVETDQANKSFRSQKRDENLAARSTKLIRNTALFQIQRQFIMNDGWQHAQSPHASHKFTSLCKEMTKIILQKKFPQTPPNQFETNFYFRALTIDIAMLVQAGSECVCVFFSGLSSVCGFVLHDGLCSN